MQTNSLPQKTATKAARARLVMQALGLTPGSDSKPADVDLSAIPKEVIVEVLRDLEDALPHPDHPVPVKPEPRSAFEKHRSHSNSARWKEHPRLAAILLSQRGAAEIATQLNAWPSNYAQRVALDLGRISQTDSRNIRRMLERAKLWPAAR